MFKKSLFYGRFHGFSNQFTKFGMSRSIRKSSGTTKIRKLMHHCVNNTETYYERMSQQESYILFLRKAEQPTEAYYTLEVEPDGTIRQTRTFYNQQNEDIELARDFLVKWQKQLKKKLAKEDYKLAVKSQSLRKKEIDELRSKGVRVNGVGYCNKLLAEILEEDLMEAGNRELEEQAA